MLSPRLIRRFQGFIISRPALLAASRGAPAHDLLPILLRQAFAATSRSAALRDDNSRLTPQSADAVPNTYSIYASLPTMPRHFADVPAIRRERPPAASASAD